MKKWIMIVIIIVIVVVGVLYLQLPFAPTMTITYNGKSYQPTFTICDWRTNSFHPDDIKMFWEMLEKEEPLFVTKSWEVVNISTSSRMGLKTIKWSDKDEVFVYAIGNGHNLKDMYPIPEKEMRDMTIVNLTDKNFVIDMRVFDQGTYDYSISAHYNAGNCSHFFKIKVE